MYMRNRRTSDSLLKIFLINLENTPCTKQHKIKGKLFEPIIYVNICHKNNLIIVLLTKCIRYLEQHSSQSKQKTYYVYELAAQKESCQRNWLYYFTNIVNIIRFLFQIIPYSLFHEEVLFIHHTELFGIIIICCYCCCCLIGKFSLEHQL